jgi:transposase
MDRQTLRDWVHQYNRHGPSSLISRYRPGRPPSIIPLQKAELLEIMLAGGLHKWAAVNI